MPNLAFLHGNLSVGYCAKDDVVGVAGLRCRRCGDPFEVSKLLYPVREKDYASDPGIARQWRELRRGFKSAFMITVFGYSAPKTDVAAVAAMKEAWGTPDDRSMEQTSFITIQDEDEVREAWRPFIHSHHYEVHANFYDSWLANHPRRTGEAYLSQYIDAKFIPDNPIPKDLDFPELWQWYDQFRAAEVAKGGS